MLIVQHDAVEVVAEMIPVASPPEYTSFSPIPGRRSGITNRLLPALCARTCAPACHRGFLHAATDWKDYAAQILAAFDAEPLLENSAAGYAARPAYRPLTKFERRGIGLGHAVWDVVFRRR